MIENARLDRLLTQVNCRMTSITRLRDAGAISNRKAELKQKVELRAKLCGRSTVRVLPLTPRTRLGARLWARPETLTKDRRFDRLS